jgi:hypothetical protein
MMALKGSRPLSVSADSGHEGCMNLPTAGANGLSGSGMVDWLSRYPQRWAHLSFVVTSL